MSNKAKTKIMYQDGKPALTPKLRFPEFRNAPGWEETLLTVVLTEHGLKSDGVSEVHSVSVHKGVINQKEHLGRSYAAADTSNYNLAQPYDIIYTKSPTGDFPFGVVKQNKLGYNVIVSPLYGVFEPSNRFLGYIFDAYFESPIRTKNYLAPITQKGAKNTIQITNDTFISKGLYIPLNEREQQKIADCLSSVDELIAAQARKVDALKTHKTGLMQHLLPREGKTQPRLRFPEFQNAEEWTIEPLQMLYEFQPTNTYSRDQLNYDSGTVKNIHYGDIHTKFATEFHIEAELVPFVNASESLAKVKSDAYCKEGDMIFADASEDLVDVGKSIEIVNLNGEKVLSGSHTILARQKRSALVTGFAGYLFKSRGIRVQIEKESQGTKVMSISPGRLAGITVCFPLDRDEQKNIADCFFSLDEQLTAQIQKLDALKTHKKGLMQQLFPSIESNS